MRISFITMIGLSIIASAFQAECNSTEPGWNEAGVRLGIQVSRKYEYFQRFEAFAIFALPGIGVILRGGD